jgi:hypothetical protein
MANERITKLASEVRYSLTEIRELQLIGNLTDSQTEKIVMTSHEARHESLQPLKEMIARGVNFC